MFNSKLLNYQKVADPLRHLKSELWASAARGAAVNLDRGPWLWRRLGSHLLVVCYS